MAVVYRNTFTGRVVERDQPSTAMDRSRRWQRAEGGVSPEPELYDPSQHGVHEVNDYLADAAPAERERVLQAETDGKGRTTILNGPHADLNGT